MKSSKLKVGDKIMQMSPNGPGSLIPLEITDIDHEYCIIGMGPYGCSLQHVHISHKFINVDGNLEEITND